MLSEEAVLAIVREVDPGAMLIARGANYSSRYFRLSNGKGVIFHMFDGDVNRIRRMVREALDGGTDVSSLELPPGSYAADTVGCTCPIAENQHGNGTIIDGATYFLIRFDCPLHGLGNNKDVAAKEDTLMRKTEINVA